MERLLKINEIIIDADLYPRAEWNWQTSYDYAQSMKTGAKFPPILVARYNRKYYLVDGRHRLEAIKQVNSGSNGQKGRPRGKVADKKEIFVQANIVAVQTKKRIFELAIETNIGHGRQFSPYEKRVLIVKLGEMGYNINKISKMINIPMDKIEQFTINTVKTDFTTGKTIVLKAPLQNLDGDQVFEDLEELQKPLTANQGHLFKQVLTLFANNLVDFEDANIRAQVTQLKKYLRKVKL